MNQLTQIHFTDKMPYPPLLPIVEPNYELESMPSASSSSHLIPQALVSGIHISSNQFYTPTMEQVEQRERYLQSAHKYIGPRLCARDFHAPHPAHTSQAPTSSFPRTSIILREIICRGGRGKGMETCRRTKRGLNGSGMNIRQPKMRRVGLFTMFTINWREELLHGEIPLDEVWLEYQWDASHGIGSITAGEKCRE